MSIVSMWSNLPFDLLSFIFSFLPPDSIARARSSCRNWHTCPNPYPSTPTGYPPWFLAFPIRHHKPCCYTHNPVTHHWHELSLDFLPMPTASIRPVSSIGSLMLLRVTKFNSTTFQLGLCNPFTRQFKHLPQLHTSRTNPASGVTVLDHGSQFQFPHFRVYVAGGMSEAARGGGASYEPTVEMYDSEVGAWKVIGSVPVEFAVRLTVWTPNENVCVKGTLYWITSARVYSVMGFDIGANAWRELGVPMAEKLEFATLVKRDDTLALVGGACGGGVLVWEMDEGGKWCLVDEVPGELGLRLLAGKRNWESVKCVGNGDAICLYKDLGYGMVICEKDGVGRWEWVWVDGCSYIKGKQVPNCPIRGALLHPSLASFIK